MDTGMDQANSKKRIGELVTDAYKALGLSRQKLAPMVGVSQRSLYAIEKGTSVPRAHTQRQLEDVLKWRRGAIADVLSLGSDADFEEITLKDMQVPTAEMSVPVEVEDDPLQRLQEATVGIAILLRDKDREIEKLRREVQQLRNRGNIG